ncbi:MAG: hypothetical protein Q8R28_15995 [Dehalococcoidia bacterium]|nr:hypothetical protein [Dehalococcoidia bacterium]
MTQPNPCDAGHHEWGPEYRAVALDDISGQTGLLPGTLISCRSCKHCAASDVKAHDGKGWRQWVDRYPSGVLVADEKGVRWEEGPFYR